MRMKTTFAVFLALSAVLVAAATPIRVGTVDCGAFKYGVRSVTEGQYAAGWESLAAEKAADVFFYGNTDGRAFPAGSRAVDGVDVRVLLRDGKGDLASVDLGGGERALRVVREADGRSVAFYGVRLADGTPAMRRARFEALLADARNFAAVVFAGSFGTTAAAEYDVFTAAGCRLANGSAEYGTLDTADGLPTDNIIVSSGLDFAEFEISQYYRINSNHYPLVARIDEAAAVAAEKRTVPSVAAYFELPLAERVKWFANGAFRVPMRRAGYVRGEGVLSRWVDVDGIPNLRDVGGLRTLDGRELRRGLLYRSAGWNDNAKTPKDAPESSWTPGKARLTEKGREQMKALGIKTDLDLRTARECWGMTGSPLGEDVRWIQISFGSYARFKAKPEFRTAVKKVFEVLADEANYPLVFHCIGGADRTGCLALMIEELCGVDEDTALKDWELTGVRTVQLNFVHAKTINHFLSHLAEYPGDIAERRMRAFLADCGVTPAQMESVRRIMLGSAAPR